MNAAAGAEYVRAMSVLKSDRLARSAFQALVLRLVPPRAVLFDFGAGPGTDARFYAQQGLTVHAYDPDPRMCEYFTSNCEDLIAAGAVTFETGSYRDFLRRVSSGGQRQFDLVTANFAPLNLVADLPELFAAFDALTRNDGRVVAGVLSPYYLGDMKYGWWWRNAARLCKHGHYTVAGASGPIIRRSIGEFAARCLPRFTLERIYRSLPGADDRSPGLDPSSRRRSAWLYVSTCRFMFLQFRKSQAMRVSSDSPR